MVMTDDHTSSSCVTSSVCPIKGGSSNLTEPVILCGVDHGQVVMMSLFALYSVFDSYDKEIILIQDLTPISDF